MKRDPLSLCLFGAAPDTGNLGVSALCHATVTSIKQLDQDLQVLLFDHRPGGPVEAEPWHREQVGGVRRAGGYLTRRIHRPESLWNIRMTSRLGGIANPAAKAILRSSAILDLSGGDSFTDLYGPRRFHAVTLPKRLAIELELPLVLLPQTYGPFNSLRAKRAAQQIVSQATMCWARDARSFEALTELMDNDHDLARYRQGVDVAFGLEARPPGASESNRVTCWLAAADAPVIGLNVSGLIFNDPAKASRQYGLRADYRQVILRFIERLLRETNARILLVPHVVTPHGHYESDTDACQIVTTEVGETGDGRLAVAPTFSDPREVKWLIAQTDWFCGTRMHSTIAALSSGVPTAAIAYSLKTQGVFETCNQGDMVVDPRELETEEVIERLWNAWSSRAAAKQSLDKALPGVKRQAQEQMREILEVALSPSGRPAASQ